MLQDDLQKMEKVTNMVDVFQRYVIMRVRPSMVTKRPFDKPTIMARMLKHIEANEIAM